MYRTYFLAIKVYKCAKGKNPVYLSDLFVKKNPGYNLRDSDLIIQPKFKTFTYGYKSFSYFGAKIWNALSPDLKSCDSLPSFKKKLKNWCQSSDARKLNTF